VVLVVNLVMTGMALARAEAPAAPTALRTNDPLFPKQEALFNRINVFEAWKVTRGDPNVRVGVIDHGFDFYHPDLRANLVPGFFAGGTYHTEFFQNVAHGTVVASLIAAVGNNGLGMTGLAPGCRVLAASQGMVEHKLAKLQNQFRQDHPDRGPGEFFKTLKAEDKTSLKSFSRDWIRFVTTSIAEAIHYLVDHNIKVINISEFLKQSAGPADSWKIVEEAFAYARERGVIIVLAAGNNGTLCEDYPGNPDAVIVVGATRLDDTRWEETLDVQGTKIKQGSNFGKRLTVMAPTEGLQVCMPHDKRFYTCEDGPMGPTRQDFTDMYETFPEGATSCATPIVTSLVALIYSIRPDLDAKTVIEIIQQGCDDIGEKGYDIHTGFGRVNFGKTIKLAQTRAR
jgi:thermitase